MARHKDHLKEKIKILNQCGLTNTEAVTETLSNAKDIDDTASKMLDAFYNGDKTFVTHEASPEFYLAFLKAKFPKAETLYEDTIVSIIGHNGLMALRESKSIETCAMFNGRKLYAL